jgi:hypothetical protein
VNINPRNSSLHLGEWKRFQVDALLVCSRA